MPYIKAEDRQYFDNKIDQTIIQSAGELNYIITKLLNSYITFNGGVSYKNLNEVVGVLECAKIEIYRRIAAPYEDIKIKENGDVYNI